MNKEEQIEDVCKILIMSEGANSVTGICTDYKQMPEEMSVKYGCTRVNSALALYEADYRKRARGEWIKTGTGFKEGYICGKCKKPPNRFLEIVKPIYPFCPNCGAYMGGGEINGKV